MKSFKKVAIITVAAILVLCCCASCSSGSKYKKLREVKPEVSYGYTVVGDHSVSKDCYVYYYSGLAKDIIKKSSDTYVYGQRLFGNKMYFRYRYGKGKNHSVALFCVDVDTAVCELIYDFKNVYPTSYYGQSHPSVGTVFDSNRMLVQYNGQLQILNLQTKQIVYTADVYDKEEYTDKDSWVFPYGFSSEFGDYKGIIDGNKLRYYELKGYEYVLHEYEVETDENKPRTYVDREGNYVYTYRRSGDGYEYADCFDITTNEAVEIDELIKKLEEDKEPPASEPEQEDIYEIDGTRCKIKKSHGVEIYDEEDNLIQRINISYMNRNSKPFNDLYYLYSKDVSGYYVTGFHVVDGKLFIGFVSTYGWDDYTTPIYIYEYSISEDKIYYVGFSESGLSDLRLH